jgi:hypothetical protein
MRTRAPGGKCGVAWRGEAGRGVGQGVRDRVWGEVGLELGGWGSGRVGSGRVGVGWGGAPAP